MKFVTYRLQSELDFQRITFSLQDSSIPFTSRKYSDSSFPGVTHSEGFGDVIVSPENETALRSLIETQTNTLPVRVEDGSGSPAKKGVNVWQVILLIYALTATVMCARSWYLQYGRSEDKHTLAEWSWDGKELITKRKDTGKVLNIARDANFDQNFEFYISYSKNGIRVLEWKDQNEDGFYEETFSYDANGDYNGVQLDRNNDGLIEAATFILENNDTLKLIDPDNDGIMEVKNDED